MEKLIIEVTGYIVADRWTAEGSHYVIGGVSNIYYDVSIEATCGAVRVFPYELYTVYIDVSSLNVKRAIVNRELLGHRFDRGSVHIVGTLLDEKPEQFVTLKELMQQHTSEKPTVVDHTFGEGTVWEQMRRDR